MLFSMYQIRGKHQEFSYRGTITYRIVSYHIEGVNKMLIHKSRITYQGVMEQVLQSRDLEQGRVEYKYHTAIQQFLLQ